MRLEFSLTHLKLDALYVTCMSADIEIRGDCEIKWRVDVSKTNILQLLLLASNVNRKHII